jgi:hypothetical protein
MSTTVNTMKKSLDIAECLFFGIKRNESCRMSKNGFVRSRNCKVYKTSRINNEITTAIC